MTSTPAHPLQATLERVRTASYTAIDLYDIAQMRKDDPSAPSGNRKLIADARQESLYRATIAASIGVVEELFESVVTEYARATAGDAAAETIGRFVASKMQSTSPHNLRESIRIVADADISDHWSALQRCSHVQRNETNRAKGENSKLLQLVAGNSHHNEILSTSRLTNVISLFTNIRHSFAHQDSSKVILQKSDVDQLRKLARVEPQEWKPDSKEMEFIENYSCACAIRLNPACAKEGDPLVDWKIHGVHAQNSIHLFVGLTMSVVGCLTELLHRNHPLESDEFLPLTLNIQRGEWSRHWPDPTMLDTDTVKLNLTEYRPRSR